jgi:lysozyme
MMMMKLSLDGLERLKKLEAFRALPYRDSRGVPTIGYGATYYPGGARVTMADPAISEARASQMLAGMVKHYEDGINACVKVPLTQAMIDALVLFAYNVGVAAAQGSTLMRLLNAGAYRDAASQFLRWNKAEGKVEDGLTRRRQYEQTLFLSGGIPK